MTRPSLGELWPRVEPILDRALDLEPTERSAYLDAACGGDTALRESVERLLASADAPSGAVDLGAAAWAAPVLAAAEAEAMQTPVGTRVGPYRIVRPLGHGGMGIVFIAERDDDQYRKAVALKLVRAGLQYDTHLRQRFVEERQILASLEHPHIARLLEGGVTPEGEPWFAMEFIDGLPLDRWCISRGASTEERLRLFLSVCDAVQYAHRNLVIHRDLKPTNILVTADGEVKLLDFGIAKLLDPASPGGCATLTGAAQPLTPEYASPEQLLGLPVSTAVDVYSLGVVLYELLTGTRPLRFTDQPQTDWSRIAAERIPVAPSSVSPGTRGLRGDLDTIVLMALRKEPERRYASVEQFAGDIRRHLDGLPVTARADTLGYRTAKFVRRNRTAVGFVLLLAAILVGGVTEVLARGREATRQAARAEQVKDFLISIFDEADPSGSNGSDLTARQLLDLGTRRVDSALAGDAALRAEMLEILGEIHTDRGEYARADSLLGRSVALSREIVPPVPGLLALRLTRQAWPLIYLTRYARAESLLTEAIAIAPEPHDSSYYESLNALGAVRRRTGDLAGAERLYRELLAYHVAVHGPGDRLVADQLNDLAVVLVTEKNLAGAESAYVASEAIRRKVLGPDQLRTILSQGGIANVRSLRGDLPGAILLERDVVARLDRLYPEDRVRRATHRFNLAGMLLRADSLETGIQFASEAVAMREAVLGPTHADTQRARELLTELRHRVSLVGAPTRR